MARWGFPLELAYVVTDYFAQGLTFRADDTRLAHMCKPPNPPWHRASIYVMHTRFRSMAALHLLCPLWPPGDTHAEARIKTALRAMLQPDPDLAAEWNRLVQLARDTAPAVLHLRANAQAAWIPHG